MKNHFLVKFVIMIIIIFKILTLDEEFYVMNPQCKEKLLSNYKKETYLGDSFNFLMEVMRGKIQLVLNETTLNNFDLNLISRINKNIPCVYAIKNNIYSNNKTTGIFLGAGINLLNYDYEEMKEILQNTKIKDKKRYLNLINIVQNINYKVLVDEISSDIFNDIDQFNKAVMSYRIKRYLETTQDKQNYKSPVINALLSAYLQFFNGDYYLKKYLSYSVTSTSYIIENLIDIVPFARLIQSKLILMMDGTIRFNNNHIIFVVPLFLYDEKNIIQIKNLINWLYKSVNYNLNLNRISILALTNAKDFSKIIIYNGKNEVLDGLFKIEYKNKSELVDLDKIYENLNLYFDNSKIKDLFENKIITLCLNYDTQISNNYQVLIDKYKTSYGMQTIPIINIETCKITPSVDIFKYNIFYNYTEEKIYFAPLKLALSNMHIYLDISNEDINEKRINDINLNDIDAPIYIEVDIKEENNILRYYEISLEINKPSEYNIFISDSNPYPSIKDHTIKYLKYENKLNPKLIMKSINIKKFFIAIEGVLHCNIIVKKKLIESEDKMKELELNEGEYKDKNFNISIQLKDKYLPIQIFSDDANFTDYNLYSNIFKNESLENLMKYFLRGVELDNNNEISFLNYELFLYLFGNTHLINRVYKDQENNYYLGRYIKINEYTPIDFKSEGFNRLIINKIYPFFLINKLLGNIAPSIIFNDKELKTIYNINFGLYITRLKNKLESYPECIKFEDQTPIMKFIIFCLYFSYYYDSYILKQIVNLSLKKPKYSEVLKYLSNKNQKSDLFLINYIKILEQENKLEKIMVNIILGKSLALTDQGIHFIKGFYNTMSKSKTKISVSVYDTIDNKIKTIISFPTKTDYRPEKISEFNKSHYHQMFKYNGTNKQNMNFDKIINFGLSQFSKYDNGIKKKLIILCYENLITNEGYYVNHNIINVNNIKYNKLIDKQIELLLITTKNYEKEGFFTLFQNCSNSYNIYDNYFHINDLNNTEEYMEDLRRKIMDSSIKLNVRKRLINDFNQEKMTYYEINNQENKGDVIVIKTDINNFKFYSSLTHPFPNSNTGELIEKTDDAVVIWYEDNERVYVGLEPINTVKKQQIEIFTCSSYHPNKDCKFIGDYTEQWILYFILFFGFWLFFVIYKCKKNYFSDSITKNKKILNVFDKVK